MQYAVVNIEGKFYIISPVISAEWLSGFLWANLREDVQFTVHPLCKTEAEAQDLLHEEYGNFWGVEN